MACGPCVWYHIAVEEQEENGDYQECSMQIMLWGELGRGSE